MLSHNTQHSRAVYYIGKTYYYDKESYRDPKITCISNEYDDVVNYLQNVRHIQIVDPKDQFPILDENTNVCAMIEKDIFSSGIGEYGDQHHFDEFTLAPYEFRIDHSMAGISKSDADEILLPAIVIQIINNEIETVRSNLDVTTYSLKELLYYINGMKVSRKSGIRKQSQILMQAIQLLEFYREDGGSLEKGISKRHPILFCSEPEYRSAINAELGKIELNREYRQQLELDI